MAIHHARPGELVDLNDWPPDVSSEKSHTIIINNNVELGRLVLPRGKQIREHRIPSPIMIQCMAGTIELRTERARQSISEGQLVYLEPGDPHSLTALDDAIVLLTIIFNENPAHQPVEPGN